MDLKKIVLCIVILVIIFYFMGSPNEKFNLITGCESKERYKSASISTNQADSNFVPTFKKKCAFYGGDIEVSTDGKTVSCENYLKFKENDLGNCTNSYNIVENVCNPSWEELYNSTGMLGWIDAKKKKDSIKKNCTEYGKGVWSDKKDFHDNVNWKCNNHRANKFYQDSKTKKYGCAPLNLS